MNKTERIKGGAGMESIPERDSAYLNLGTAKASAEQARYMWEQSDWPDCVVWINDAILLLESARAKVLRHAEIEVR